MAKFPIMVANTDTLGSSFTWLAAPAAPLDIGWTINANFRDALCPIPVTLSEFYFHLNNAPGGSATRTLRVRKNAVADNLQMTFGSADTDKSDLTNATTLAAGDYFDISAANSGVTTSSVGTRWCMQTTSENQILWANTGAALASTRYTGIQDVSTTAATGAAAEQVMPTSGKFRNLYGRIPSALASGNYVVTLYQNGSPTSLTITFDSGSGAAVNNTTNSVTFAAGDRFYWEYARNAPGANKNFELGVEFVADIPGEGVLLCSSGTALGTTTTYNTWYAAAGNYFNSTESTRQALGMPCRIKKMYVYLQTAQAAGTRTITFRKGGAGTALTVPITSGQTGSLSKDIDIAQGDLIGIEHANTSGSSVIEVGLVYKVPTGGAFFMFMD